MTKSNKKILTLRIKASTNIQIKELFKIFSDMYERNCFDGELNVSGNGEISWMSVDGETEYEEFVENFDKNSQRLRKEIGL